MSRPAMDWRHAYNRQRRIFADQLRSLRAQGIRHAQLGESARPVRPAGMTDREIEDIALREAERYVQQAINRHNEQIERAA